jgi:hypothetical protein
MVGFWFRGLGFRGLGSLEKTRILFFAATFLNLLLTEFAFLLLPCPAHKILMIKNQGRLLLLNRSITR